jgi:FkbM family methyltransferase
MKALGVRCLQALGCYGAARSLGRRVLACLPAARRQRRRMKAFYAQFIRPGDLCFDVGANLGDRTAVFVELGARVVAVEPQSRCRRRLERRFRRSPQVRLVPRALGAEPGELVMKVSDADSISSLSPEWIASVKASGRFADYTWDRTETVAVTTLDRLVAEHGRPRFCKIDVEGFEAEVLRGLTQPLEVVSFEFTPEYLQAALASVRRLAGLGRVRFNYSEAESMRLALPAWVGAEAIVRLLTALPDPSVFGDVYAKFTSEPGPGK